MSTIAIVILNWNGRQHLETFLPSVLAGVQPASSSDRSSSIAALPSTVGSVPGSITAPVGSMSGSISSSVASSPASIPSPAGSPVSVPSSSGDSKGLSVPAFRADVYVADNASTDDSLEFLRRQYPQVRLIILDRNYGFARGYNEALRQVDSDYYVLLNSDVEVEKGWLDPMIALMERDPSVGACQPKIRMYTERTSFEYAGAAGGWIDYLGYPFARGRIFDVCEKDEGQYDTEEPVFWASGAAMCVRAGLYHRLGGLDPYFFAHMEEIDLCWRIQLAGYKVYACPAAVVYHLGGGTLPKGNARKVYLNFRNNLIMLSKNLPAGQLWWKMPCRMFLDTISAWKALLEGDSSFFRAVAAAHGAYIKWLLFNRKQSIFPEKRGPGRDGWYSHSIIWKYFVAGKKTFAEIIGDKS